MIVGEKNFFLIPKQLDSALFDETAERLFSNIIKQAVRERRLMIPAGYFLG
jgi:hypothetical protein